MPEAKYTPGPWVASTDAIGVVFIPGDNPDGRHPETVAVVQMPRGSEETAANAQLIAAAPEMLAALQKIVQVYKGTAVHMSYMAPLVAEARAAIANATGADLAAQWDALSDQERSEFTRAFAQGFSEGGT